ncbi:hypothetical protein F4604DRAFT_1917594 [Suillus subluteus]|nr:hypothetical protein F4604DRAFT_1917594 [Suillus subluteus]
MTLSPPETPRLEITLRLADLPEERITRNDQANSSSSRILLIDLERDDFQDWLDHLAGLLLGWLILVPEKAEISDLSSSRRAIAVVHLDWVSDNRPSARYYKMLDTHQTHILR